MSCHVQYTRVSDNKYVNTTCEQAFDDLIQELLIRGRKDIQEKKSSTLGTSLLKEMAEKEPFAINLKAERRWQHSGEVKVQCEKLDLKRFIVLVGAFNKCDTALSLRQRIEWLNQSMRERQ